MGSSAFTLVCDHLERSTGLDRSAARGTVRLALREAGLDPEAVSAGQMSVVTKTILPIELRALRISDVEGHCHALQGRLRRLRAGRATGGDGQSAGFEGFGES